MGEVSIVIIGSVTPLLFLFVLVVVRLLRRLLLSSSPSVVLLLQGSSSGLRVGCLKGALKKGASSLLKGVVVDLFCP